MNNELIALQAHIDDMNDKFDARMKAEGATFWGTFALTAEDMQREYGVGTVEQFKEWMYNNDAAEDEKEARKASYGTYDEDEFVGHQFPSHSSEYFSMMGE